MAHYPAESDIATQLVAQGEAEAELLARVIADGGYQDAVEYPDPLDPTATLIDAGLAAQLGREAGSIEHHTEGADAADR